MCRVCCEAGALVAAIPKGVYAKMGSATCFCTNVITFVLSTSCRRRIPNGDAGPALSRETNHRGNRGDHSRGHHSPPTTLFPVQRGSGLSLPAAIDLYACDDRRPIRKSVSWKAAAV